MVDIAKPQTAELLSRSCPHDHNHVCQYSVQQSAGAVELLREEFIAVLGSAKLWDKTTLSQLKMLDSHMKESNRMHPATFSKPFQSAH